MFDRLTEDIDAILERDPAAESRMEVALCYPGFHAVQLHRVARWCYIQGWATAARLVSHAGRFLTGIEIHPAAKIGRRVFINHGMGVVIGETAVVGDDCTIYQGVTLGGVGDKTQEKRHPTLGRGVIVGAGAQVLGDITVGENARIGSNAIVVKPVGKNAIVMGVAMRVGQKGAEAALPNESESYAVYGVQDDPNSPKLQELRRLVKEQGALIEDLKSKLGDRRAGKKSARSKTSSAKEKKIVKKSSVAAKSASAQKKSATDKKVVRTAKKAVKTKPSNAKTKRTVRAKSQTVSEIKAVKVAVKE